MKRYLPYGVAFSVVAGAYLLGAFEFADRTLADASFRLARRHAGASHG